MAIKNWHGGKVALVWVICFFLLAILFRIGTTAGLDTGEALWAMFLLLLGVWIAPFIVTWRWLSSRQKTQAMAIKHWHGGKVAMLWVVSPFLGLLLFRLEPYPQGSMEGLILLLISSALWFSPFLVTWRWLSGREKDAS